MAEAIHRMQVTGSRVGGVSLGQAMQKARADWRVTALQVGAIAVAFLGGIGLAASYFIDRTKNQTIAHNGKEVLAKYYRNQIAAQLGIDPKRVTVGDLELAAKNNKALANAVEKVEQEKNNNNRANMFAIGASAALGGVGPVLSGLNHMAAHGVASITGSSAASLFDKNILYSQDVMEMLDAKQRGGSPILATDIVMLRVAQDVTLQKKIKSAFGAPFHKMNEAQQRAVLVSMPDFGNAPEIANRVNGGIMSIQDALMQTAASASWAQRVGGPRPAQGSFTDRLNAQRASQNVTAQGV